MSTALISSVQMPFPRDVLRFLLTRETSIANTVVASFVRGYVKWLYKCAEQEMAALPGGGIKLQRWLTEDGSSYGYIPSDVAFYIMKLNDLFYSVMSYTYLRHTGRLGREEKILAYDFSITEEVLKGFSRCLGFYVLDCYFSTKVNENGRAWFSQLCNLSTEFPNLETWRPADIEQNDFVLQVLSAPKNEQEPYYNERFIAFMQQEHKSSNYRLDTVPSINTPAYSFFSSYAFEEGFNAGYYKYGYPRGHSDGYHQGYRQGHNQGKKDAFRMVYDIGAKVFEAERKRLVTFIKSLRQTLNVLENDPNVLVEDKKKRTPVDEKQKE